MITAAGEAYIAARAAWIAQLEPLIDITDLAARSDGTVILEGSLRITTMTIADDSAAAIRTALARQAEAVIALIEGNGWQHVDHPEIHIGGQVCGYADRPQARSDEPIRPAEHGFLRAEGTLHLVLRRREPVCGAVCDKAWCEAPCVLPPRHAGQYHSCRA